MMTTNEITTMTTIQHGRYHGAENGPCYVWLTAPSFGLVAPDEPEMGQCLTCTTVAPRRSMAQLSWNCGESIGSVCQRCAYELRLSLILKAEDCESRAEMCRGLADARIEVDPDDHVA
jgi:hypothetical protein